MDTLLVSRLRSDLDSAGFTVDGLADLWGPDASEALHRGQRLSAERALDQAPRSSAATLARLFVLGRAVRSELVEAALPSLGASGAVELGLVRASDADMLEPAYDLRPYSFVDERGEGRWWIVSDLGELALGTALGTDHVLGIGGASTTLSGLMIQKPVGNALDLGTGCGIQALHAARFSECVVATDVSARALDLARLNALLNRVDNVEFRRGDLFEPVAGSSFDLIVSNPPFVITPRSDGVPAYEYRDGGMVGDALVARVVRGAAACLAPGGIAQFLGNWEYREKAGTVSDGLERVRRWVEEAESGLAADRRRAGVLDAWVIERERLSVSEYAETWIRDGGTRPGTPEFERLYGAWLDDFAERGVTAVGFGYVLMRRAVDGPGGPGKRRGMRRFERLPDAVGQNDTGLGSHLGQLLERYDWQSAREDPDLAAAVLVVAPDVTEERHYRPGDEDPSVILLRQGGGFGRTVSCGTALAALVGACDGTLTVGAIVDAIAVLLDVDAQALLAETMPRVRGLLDEGFLVPASSSEIGEAASDMKPGGVVSGGEGDGTAPER